MECWIRTTVTIAINTAYTGGLYRGDIAWRFPVKFADNNVVVTCSHFKWGTAASWATVSDVTAEIATLRGIDAVSRASGSCVFSARAIGQWK